jgi:hypothetical protein
MQMCDIFHHEDVALQLDDVLRWLKVVQQGPNDAPTSTTDELLGRELPAGNLRPTREDINSLRIEGIDGDDDNDPVPENIPDDDNANTRGLLLHDRQVRKRDAFCRRAMAKAYQLIPGWNQC